MFKPQDRTCVEYAKVSCKAVCCVVYEQRVVPLLLEVARVGPAVGELNGQVGDTQLLGLQGESRLSSMYAT
jgi:hypothetical protein